MVSNIVPWCCESLESSTKSSLLLFLANISRHPLTFRSTMTTLQECRKHEGFLSSRPISAFMAAQAPPLKSSSSACELEACETVREAFTFKDRRKARSLQQLHFAFVSGFPSPGLIIGPRRREQESEARRPPPCPPRLAAAAEREAWD